MKLAKIFGDNMVLQAGKEIRIFGTCQDGENIRANLGNTGASCKGEGGVFLLTLPPMEVSRNMTLTVTGESETAVIHNVAVGEVFLAGGQSNMEFFMRYDKELPTELECCENEDIRFFDYPEVSYPEAEDEYDFSRFGYWRPCDAGNLEYYSAVAYYFAKKLQGDLGVPVGIVGCNWGGTSASSWMSEAYLKKHGQVWMDDYERGLADIDLKLYYEGYHDLEVHDHSNPFASQMDEMMWEKTREEQFRMMEHFDMDERGLWIGPRDPGRPCSLYEQMLSPLKHFSIRGFLYYQGESDDVHADIYADVLSDLIDCWRDSFGEMLPFLFVQIAPFGIWLDCTADRYVTIREQQQMVADHKPGCYMISSSDSGMIYDIHPKYKRPIGERLAMAAEQYIYDFEKVEADNPRGVSGEITQMGLLIHFENARGGLSVRGECPNGFQVTAKRGEESKALLLSPSQYQILGEDVLLAIAELNYESYQVEFAKAPYYEVNLYNQAGIPAVPFALALNREAE
ncbi:MAG: sialate O-acetylesterase [Clostridiales bacterium]|nr:sialate O-acetylesterase [Clostridiales bacterium]